MSLHHRNSKIRRISQSDSSSNIFCIVDAETSWPGDESAGVTRSVRRWTIPQVPDDTHHRPQGGRIRDKDKEGEQGLRTKSPGEDQDEDEDKDQD